MCDFSDFFPKIFDLFFGLKNALKCKFHVNWFIMMFLNLSLHTFEASSLSLLGLRSISQHFLRNNS